jgi:hypothetical protein
MERQTANQNVNEKSNGRKILKCEGNVCVFVCMYVRKRYLESNIQKYGEWEKICCLCDSGSPVYV